MLLLPLPPSHVRTRPTAGGLVLPPPPLRTSKCGRVASAERSTTVDVVPRRISPHDMVPSPSGLPARPPGCPPAHHLVRRQTFPPIRPAHPSCNPHGRTSADALLPSPFSLHAPFGKPTRPPARPPALVHPDTTFTALVQHPRTLSRGFWLRR